METIAIINPKGGTGKSLTAFALSKCLAERGYKVLAVDADWQGTLAKMCGVETEACTSPLEKVLSETGKVKVASLALSKDGFALIPWGVGFRHERHHYERTALKNALRSFERFFDYCIIDAPPDTGVWCENILMAAQRLIVPDCCDVPGMFFLEPFYELVRTVKKVGNPDLRFEGILFTLADENPIRKTHLKQTANRLGCKVFRAEIPYDVFLDRSSVEKMCEYAFSSVSPVGDKYRTFTAEFLSSALPG